ncbi:MAG: efflux RND transporter periplasmic adaptor subunit [Alphaproteobacteria bacterium]|nr:efflux RND transporter periplasmic adaptor subunit [Alphaproteobacteria bacterium]
MIRSEILAGSALRYALALLTILALGTAHAQQAPDAPRVAVAEVGRRDVTPSFSYVGRVEAVESVELIARVEGFLKLRNFLEGGEVRKGELLFLIERAPYQIAVEQRRADLAGARATLENAEQDFARKETLVKRKTLAQASLDEARAARGTARAEVQQAEAALKRAELDLAYTQILSPIDGRISRATFSDGSLVGPNSGALATVTSVDPVYVTIAVTDKDLLKARRQGIDLDDPKVSPSVILADGSAYEHDGDFDYLAPNVNRSTDTVLARAVFPNPKRVLLPGQFVTVIVKQKQPTSALVIPQVAVQEDQKGYFVLVVDRNNRVSVRRVTLGEKVDTDWVVSDGLTDGERVVVQGLQKIRPNMIVNPVAEQS